MFPTALLASVALAASIVGWPPPSPPPVPRTDPQIPRVSADSWIVYDLGSDTVLARWNADVRRPMASVTKVMTAMVVLDHAPLEEMVVVAQSAVGARGSVAGLVAGERLTVSDLMTAMMVRSGNDAANALALHVGNGSMDAFVALMNAKGAAVGLDDTSFANPSGLDHERHYSTAADLLTLTRASLDYPDIGRISSIKAVSLAPDPNGRARDWVNTNALLATYPGVIGLKTGDTPWADKVLLGVSERHPRTIVSVVMHSDDHFVDTRELVDWGFRTSGLRDRFLRPLFTDHGGGGSSSVDVELSDSHQRRVSRLLPLDDGRWRTSRLEDLPKGALLAEWLGGALPEAAGGGG